MNKPFNLALPVMCLSLIVSNCGQVAPTAQSEVVLQQDDEIVLPQSAGNPMGDCCPEGFVRVFDVGNPADRNGDNQVCLKRVLEGTITIDNNVPGDCCTPPNCT